MSVILKFLDLDVLMTDDWLLSWLISQNSSYYLDEDEQDSMDLKGVFAHWISRKPKKMNLVKTFFTTIDKDHAMNDYFDESEIGSMQLMVNLGSTLVYLVFISVSLLFYSLFVLLINYCPK
jgi:hypothetical protein